MALTGPSPGFKLERKYKIQIQIFLSPKEAQCLQSLQQHKHMLESTPAKFITKQGAVPQNPETLMNSKFIVSSISSISDTIAKCQGGMLCTLVRCYLFISFIGLANKPKPTVSRTSNFDTMFPGESITFECTVAISSGWDFLWYHNGEEIQQPSSSYTIERVDHDKSGEYHCRAKRGKDPFYTEDSIKATLQISGKFNVLT